MRAVVQRVLQSDVSVNGQAVGEISKGLNVLLGVVDGDTEKEAEVLAAKIAKLRIFEDEQEKMNLCVTDVDGEILVISQFTLCADCKKGNRPSFTGAMHPEQASEYYDRFCELLKQNGIKRVEKGIFGADMKVELLNDGPVTILLEK